MKLHLPTRLRSAVLACITAVAAVASTVGTGVVTTGVVAYTIAVSQAEAREVTTATTVAGDTTYNGYVYTMLLDKNVANFHERNFALATYEGGAWVDGTTYAGSGSAETPLGTGIFWTQFCATASVANSINYYGNTLHLGATSAQVKVTPAFTDFCLGGLVVEKGSMSSSADTTAGSAYWFYRGGSMQFNGTGDVNMDIADHVRFSYANEVAIKKSGVWNIASTGSISFDNNSQNTPTTLKLEANQHVTIQGGGKVNVGRNGTYNMSLAAGSVLEVNGSTMAVAQGTTTIEAGAALTIGAGSVVTHSSIMNAAGTINNSGALTLGATNLTGSIANAAAGSSLTLTGALTFDVTNITAGAAALLDVSKGTFDYSGGSLALTGDTLLADGEYALVKAADETAAAAIATVLTSSLHTISNDGNVVKLTVASTGMETLTEDLVGAPNNNFHKVCVNGLNVGEHTITATYSTAGYSTLYTKDLKGSGDITFSRTFTGDNLCVLWVDGDATEYTGTISMGNGQNGNNVFLKLGSANGESDLSNATVNMTKEVIALGNHATIGSLTANETEIRAVDGTVDNIANMSTGMKTTTAGFAQAGGVIRKLTITTSGELTNTTINSGVTLAVAQGASVTLNGGTMNGLISNSGAMNLAGALTLNGPIMMGADSSATFANDVLLDLSKLTPDDDVYTILLGSGTSNLGSLTSSNVTGIDLTGKTVTFDNSGTITLVDNTSDLIWKGGAGTWDETSQNWTKGGDPAIFADADRVTFNDESEVTLVGDLIAGGMNVNAAVILEGSGSLDAKEITIGETGSLTINGDATVSVDREKLNKMQVSGDGTLEINKIGTDALAFDGGDAGFSGTLALTQDVAPTGHSFTTTLTNFTGTVVIDALINHAASDFGDASKLVFVGSRDTNQIGFWCGTGINPTLEQDIEITGDNEVRFFLNGTTLNGDITGNKLRLHSGTGTFGGTVNLNRLNLATDNLVLNLKADSTLGELVHDGNRTTLNVGDNEHQVTLNITGAADRIMNTKSHTYTIGTGSVINDNTYLRLTNSTLTINGGGVYNVRGLELSAEGAQVGNLEIAAGTTLHVTGTTVSADGHKGSFMLSHWNATNTINLDGTLISEAGISGRDGTANINIKNGGLLQLNAGFVTSTARTNNATINVKEGGTLKVASTPTAYNDQIAVNLENGSTFEGTATNTTIAQNLTISGGSAETPATANVKVDTDKSLTLSGVISGDNGALNKTGEGTLVLSGANTYAGGTNVQGGTLDVSGGIGTGDVSVGSGATIILHSQLDATKLTNNGTLEIASGFSGLEGAGVIGIEGGAEGNGFNQGGETNIFKTTGVVDGTLSAVFNGATVAITADGTLTLTDDWGTYHINNALLETETFNAIKTAAAAHSANLAAIDFAAENQTLKVDADGFATSMVQGEQASTAQLAVNDGQTIIVDTATLPTLQLAEGGSATLALQNSASATVSGITGGSTLNVTGTSSADTLTFNNGNINRELNITDATVEAGNVNGTGFNTQATNVNAGGVLRLAGQDSLGWGANAAGLITLTGSAEKVATLELGARQTLKTSIAMNGNSVITAITEGDHSSPMIDPYGGKLTVTGTNNTINTGVRQRSAWEIEVQEDATLVFDGTELSLETTEGDAGITKKGAGSLTFLNASGTLRNYTADAGETILDNTVFTVGSNLDLSHGGNAAGVVKLTNASALNFANGVNLWMNDHTSLEMDETSSVTFTREDYTLAIKGVTEGTPAVIAGAQNAFYDLNDACSFSNAEVTMTSSADKTMGTKLADVDLVNAGSGTLTVSHTENTAFTSVNAQGGDITLNAATSIGSLTIAGGKTVTAAASDPLSITTALTAGAGSTLASALTIGNGAALDLVTGDNALSLGSNALTLGTGLTITEAMKSAIEALEADASLTLMKGVTSLTGGDIAATDVFTGLTGDYTIKVQDGNLVVNAAALPAADLTWLGGDGTWGGTGTPWTSEGGASAYVEGANVTIGGEGGEEGGTITVSGAQTAKSVTIVESGYTITRGGNSDSLTVTGDLTVNEGVTANLGFLPTIGGNIVVNENASLDAKAIGLGNESGTFNTLLDKTTGAGTLAIQGGGSTVLTGNSSVNVSTLDVTGTLEINSWKTKNCVVTLGEGKTMTVHGGQLVLESSAVLTVDGGTLDAQGGIKLGHATVGGNPGVLNMTGGEIKATTIELSDLNHANTMTITGGTLTITGESAFTGTGTNTTVTVNGATITNGEENMAFNHGSTLTGATVTAQEGTTITVGGTGLTTNVATGLTTNGTVTMAGTTAVTGAATITDNGTLTIDSLAGAEGSNVTLAGTGTTTITGGTADTLTAGKDATVGDLTVKTLTGTGTLTQTSGTTLTMADGGTLSGSVTTGAITAAGSLAKTGTDTVTTGDITGTSTALTVSGGTLSSGAVTVASAEVATGATLTSSGKLTSTGALTLNGAATADSADIASVILNAGGSLTCTNDLKLGGLTLNSAITSAGVTAASLSSDALDITASADVLGALAMGAGDSLTIVGLTSQYTNGLTLNGSSDATLDAFGYKYTVESTADGIVITKADAGIVWTGGADDEWGKGGNWQGGGIPTGDDVSASFTGKGVGDVNISTDGVTIGQVIVTSHDAAAGTKSEYTFKKGELTIAQDMKVLDGHVIIGTTVAATDVTIIPSSDTAVSSVTVNGDGSLSVSGTLAVESATDTTAGSLTIQEGGFAGIHTLASSTADVALGGSLAVEEGVIKKLTEENGTKGNLVVGSMVATMSLTPVVPDEVIILEDSEIDTLLVTGTGNLTTKGDLTAETSTDVAGTVTAEKNLTTGAMGVTSTGDVTVGSAAAPATLDVATLENAGTVTVYNTMKASTSVDNTDTGTLDIKGELQAADASVENSKTLTVGGALAADTLTTNSGATTEAKGGATIGTSLDNHGTTTVTGNLVSADTTTTAPGSAIITNDATGAGEKLVVTGNVSGASLTTDTDATTEIGGTATLADGLTNNGTTTITGATTLGGTTENTGTLATGALTAETLNNEGTLNVTGNATVKDLSSATASSLTDVSGTLTIAEGGSLSDAGDITASALDLSNLAATDKATVGNLKTNAVTLNGLSTPESGLTVGTLNAQDSATVQLTLSDEAVEQIGGLNANDTAQLVTVNNAAASDQVALDSEAGKKVASALDKKLLTYDISNGKLTILNNGFDKDLTLSQTAAAGVAMAQEAYLAEGGTPTGDLKGVTDALKSYRNTGDSAAAEKLGSALSGVSIASLGLAASNDVDRQLRAIRNRTTTMGVDQCVVNEDMPYVNAWVNAEGDYRNLDADGAHPGYKMSSWGGTIGMDIDCTPRFTCGLAATAMYGDFSTDGADNADGDVNTYYVSVFGRYAAHRWTHTGVATFGLSDISLNRTINYGDGSAKTSGDTNGTSFGAMYEIGYVLSLDEDNTTCLQPIVNVSFRHIGIDGYAEKNSNVGVKADDIEMNVVTFGVGARLQSIVGENIYNRSSIFECRAMLKVDAGDTEAETKTAMQAFGGTAHTVKSAEMGNVGFEIGAGLTVPVGQESGSIFVDASAEFRSGYSSVNGTVGYRINF